MYSKPTKSVLVALCAAVLVVPLGVAGGAGAVSSALQPANIAHPGGDDGNLYPRPATFIEGQKIEIVANFVDSVAGELVTLYKEGSPGNFESTGRTRVANSKGNAHIRDYEVNGTQKVFALAAGGHVTEIVTLVPEPLGSCTISGSFYVSPATPGEGQSVKLTANFPNSAAGHDVTFLRKVGSGDYQVVGIDDANSYGNAYITNHEIVEGAQEFYGLITDTNTCTPKRAVTPVESGAVLDENFEPAGSIGQHARASATFVPAQPGTQANLQVKTIKDDKWKTIDTVTVNSDGEASFHLSDPLEVEHKYRAERNGVTSNVVKYAGPFLDKNTGLATFYFNSYDGEPVNTRTRWFDGEYAVKAGDGSPGIEDCGAEGVLKDPDKPKVAKMRGRGNYSWSFEKKGFNINLDKGDNICGMGKGKKWALVANHYDRSLLRYAVANDVGRKFDNLAWTPEQKPVDLYVNGFYRGSYSLIERRDIDKDRIDIDELKAGDDEDENGNKSDDEDFVAPAYPIGQEKNPAHPNNQLPNITGGYILEWDFRRDGDNNIQAGDRGWVSVNSPENEDDNAGASPWQINYIDDYVDDADGALFGSNFTNATNGWRKFIDEDSAIDYYLAMEFMKPVDGNMWASVFMYKPRGEKLHFSPMWDFDMAAGSADRAGNVGSRTGWYLRNPLNVSARQSTKTWFNRLNEDPTFREAARSRWNELHPTLSSTEFINDQRDLIAKSAARNYQKWNHDKKISKYQVIESSWSADVVELRDWMGGRRAWIDRNIN